MNRIVEFFSSEQKRLVRFVKSLINNTSEQDAEDIVQDVMLNIFDKADVIKPIENLSAYIYQSLRYRMIDLFRKKKNTGTLMDLIKHSQYDAAEELEKKEIRRQLYFAIDSLKEEEKAVVIATELEDRSFRDLSQEWDVPLGTLLARKSRALKKIKKKLTD